MDKQQTKTGTMHSTLTLNTLLFSKESGELEKEGREGGGRVAGRQADRKRVGEAAAREGDEEIREMESQERRRKREG